MFSNTMIGRLDERLAVLVNGPAGNSELLDKFVHDVADSPVLKGGVFVAFYCWLWFQPGEQRDVRRMIMAAAIAAVISVAASRLLQIGLPFNQRPLHTPSLGLNIPLSVDPETLRTWSSFPSDHAILFFALGVPIWAWSRWLGLAAFAWAFFVICLPRIYLGYHYPSDVLAGAVAGIALMAVLQAAILRTPLPAWLVRRSLSSPGVFCAVAFLLALELSLLFEDVRHFSAVAVEVAKLTLN